MVTTKDNNNNREEKNDDGVGNNDTFTDRLLMFIRIDTGGSKFDQLSTGKISTLFYSVRGQFQSDELKGWSDFDSVITTNLVEIN